ncbi:MAG: copper amine oxidase N-terminal domain-containing protein [Defluviitaleaceae bacterium]|nr:copper amine oxidase N-terminal domain-containing protein [Defluviitaleaceae bacterium]
MNLVPVSSSSSLLSHLSLSEIPLSFNKDEIEEESTTNFNVENIHNVRATTLLAIAYDPEATITLLGRNHTGVAGGNIALNRRYTNVPIRVTAEGRTTTYILNILTGAITNAQPPLEDEYDEDYENDWPEVLQPPTLEPPVVQPPLFEDGPDDNWVLPPQTTTVSSVTRVNAATPAINVTSPRLFEIYIDNTNSLYYLENELDMVIIDDEFVTLTIPYELLYSLVDVDDLYNVRLYLTIYNEVVDIRITAYGEPLEQLDINYILQLSLDLEEDINTYRVVAILEDGSILGGRVELGTFVLSTNVLGSFSILYIENLRRFVLSTQSYIIVDLAENIDDILMDVRPIIQQGRTLIPIRFVAYALGADVAWNPDTATVILSLEGYNIFFAIGELVEGMDIPAQIIDSRTFVPLRFVAERLGAYVGWNPETAIIEIIRVTRQ